VGASAIEVEIEESHRTLVRLAKLKARHTTQRDDNRSAADMSAAAAERADQEAKLVEDAKGCLQVCISNSCLQMHACRTCSQAKESLSLPIT
jgi:hypothetical protein